MIRIDRESRQALERRQDERLLVSAIERVRATLAGVICSDYGKGVLTASVLPQRPPAASRLGAPSIPQDPVVLVDPKGQRLQQVPRR